MPNNEGALISEVRLITREYGIYLSQSEFVCEYEHFISERPQTAYMWLWPLKM